MGRIKDLVIELQNEYGFDLENMPEEFSVDDYLKMKANEVSEEELFCEQVKNRK
jgi:hypothetical protein